MAASLAVLTLSVGKVEQHGNDVVGVFWQTLGAASTFLLDVGFSGLSLLLRYPDNRATSRSARRL